MPTQNLIILANVPMDVVINGFIPTAKKLGLKVTLLTDQFEAHQSYYRQNPIATCPDEIVDCDVFNPLTVIDVLTCREQTPSAIFSNSDYLQSSTALVAEYFNLPRKNWHVTYNAKNKAQMRSQLATLGLDMLWHAVVSQTQNINKIAAHIPFPCIVKPRHGVASKLVSLTYNLEDLIAECQKIWSSQPGLPLLLEEFIEGPLYTLETLGDNQGFTVLGGFKVQLSPAPYFVELEARWGLDLSAKDMNTLVEMLTKFGIGFGVCHTEFVLTKSGPRIIEINYRNNTGSRVFLLQEILGIELFETVLRVYLGEALPKLNLENKAALIRYFTAEAEGVLTKAPQAFTKKLPNAQVAYKPYRKLGDLIRITHSNKDWLGMLRATSYDSRQLDCEIDKIAEELAWEIIP